MIFIRVAILLLSLIHICNFYIPFSIHLFSKYVCLKILCIFSVAKSDSEIYSPSFKIIRISWTNTPSICMTSKSVNFRDYWRVSCCACVPSLQKITKHLTVHNKYYYGVHNNNSLNVYSPVDVTFTRCMLSRSSLIKSKSCLLYTSRCV